MGLGIFIYAPRNVKAIRSHPEGLKNQALTAALRFYPVYRIIMSQTVESPIKPFYINGLHRPYPARPACRGSVFQMTVPAPSGNRLKIYSAPPLPCVVAAGPAGPANQVLSIRSAILRMSAMELVSFSGLPSSRAISSAPSK